MAFFKEKPLEVDVQVLDREPKRYQFGSPTASPHVEVPTLPHQAFPSYAASLFDVGIFRDTLAPSFALNSSLAIIAWGAGRNLNRLDTKDIIWPAAPVLNVWWSAIGRRIFLDGRTLPQALKVLSWPERLLVTGVTLWGGRLLYTTHTRTIARGKDDPKYDAVKKGDDFWNQALVKFFLPEALFQTIIALPFTAVFRHRGAVMTGYHPYIQMLAVGIFGTGFAMEALADWQLKKHKEHSDSEFKGGVWSIVRNPNFLGSTLTHLSFPILLYGSDMLAPLELLGPIANYIYLRYFAAGSSPYDTNGAVTDASVTDDSKGSVWPKLDQLQNTWLWSMVGCGAFTVAVEQRLRMYHTEGGWL